MMKKQTIPNLLTYFRILAVAVAIGLTVALPNKPLALLLLFGLAALTDFFDGYLARKWNVVTPLGTMLDPMADKLLVMVVLVYLLKFPPMPLLLVSLLLARELYIAGLREFLATRAVALPVSGGGKWKTALQLIAISVLLGTLSIAPHLPLNQTDKIWNVGISLLWASTALSLISAFNYTRKAWPHLR